MSASPPLLCLPTHHQPLPHLLEREAHVRLDGRVQLVREDLGLVLREHARLVLVAHVRVVAHLREGKGGKGEAARGSELQGSPGG